MSKIRVVGFDPSTSNWGICRALVDTDTLDIEVEDLQLVQTVSEKAKGVRKDSDDIRRAQELRGGMMLACTGAAFAISEIPFMNPGGYPAANFNSGLVTGVLSSCHIPLIQVFPADVKMIACGSRNAAKEEMIEWATAKYPDAPWLRRKLKGKMVLTAANEHLADAVAVVHAGVRTRQFEEAMSMYRAMAA